ncbi:MAG: right-handed parallel beta-helix repeat-containing protein [Acidobacteria bacterium]|jgi:parallel beta-helix repeat protein|nr:right-handed parallel beta-helix repeat-containing protein [Acidobacteriota bacterium]
MGSSTKSDLGRAFGRSGRLAFLLTLFLALSGCAGEMPDNDDIPDDPQVYEETLPPDPVYDDTNVLYVSTTGNDPGGDGSPGSPFRTIGFALERAEAGKTVVLRGGTYREAVRVRLPNITIRSHAGEWAVIQCPIQNPDLDVTVLFDVDASGGKLQRLEIVGGYYYGVMFQTKWDWGDPADRSGASRMLLEDCRIHDTGRDCVKITPGCDDIVIRRCEIYRSGRRDNGNAEGIDNVNGDRMQVEDCRIHDIATNGLYFKGGASDCVVQRNLIHSCGGGGIMVGFDTSPEFFDVKANPGYYESINGVLRNNIIFDTGYAGIGIYASLQPRIYNNTVFNAAARGQNALHFGISFQDWEPGAKRPPTAEPDIRNNIFVQAAGGEGHVVRIRHADALGGLSALSGMPSMSNNIYYRIGGGPCLFFDQRPASHAEGLGLLQWQAHISGDDGSLHADPLLDAQKKLLASSPAIDKGLDNTIVRYDIDRAVRTSPYDIGGDEH